MLQYLEPTFAKSENNHLMAFSKFSKVKYVMQLRLSVEIENSDDIIKIKRWANFGLTYDEIAQLLYLNLLPQQQFALEKKEKQLFARLYEKYLKIVYIEKEDDKTFIVTNDQYTLMKRQIEVLNHLNKESLTWITGWHSPNAFLKKLEPPQEN